MTCALPVFNSAGKLMAIFRENEEGEVTAAELMSSTGCWYIATYCPCNECDKTKDEVEFCEEYDNGPIGALALVYYEDINRQGGKCPFDGPYAGIYAKLSTIRGPFDSYADASNVLSRYETRLADYAAGCKCGCYVKDGYAAGGNYNTSEAEACMTGGELDEYFGWRDQGLPDRSNSGCWEILSGTLFANDKCEIRIMKNGVDAAYAYGGTTPFSIFVGPCDSIVTEVCSTDNGEAYFDVVWEINSINAEPCSFCSNEQWDDPSGPPLFCKWHMADKAGSWYSDWNYNFSTGTGVPNNSEELEDYLENWA
mgnify:CR=1 FL=1